VSKRWKIAAWVAFSVLVITLLVIARREQEVAAVKEPVVAISVIDENAFLTETELITRLKRNKLIYKGQKMQDLNTTAIEAFIKEMHEVEEVEVYKMLGGVWNIKVKVRQPIARIFNKYGESFYVDVKGATMAPSPNFTARVLVFSGNISDRCDSLTVPEIINNASLKSSKNLDEIYRISNYVCNDPFLQAQIGQVHRDQWGNFTLIPLVGEQEIIFGSAENDEDVKEKMEKLKVFYREGMPYEGWSKYESINLKYKDQIVCKKKKTD